MTTRLLQSISTLFSALPFIAALWLSVFFQGFEVAVFSLAQLSLLLWLFQSIWRAHPEGWRIPRNALAVTLSLFWVWLGATLLWSRVLYVSVFEFWLMGALPLAYWCYTLTPERERLWPWLAGGALALGLGLALHGIYQRFAFGGVTTSIFLNSNSFAAVLNLIALPVAATFLVQSRGRANRALQVLFACAFFLLVFAVALTKGRAATAVLMLGLVLVLAVSYRHTPKRALLTLIGLTTLAYLLATASLSSELTRHFAELQDPLRVSSMQVRFLIWESTWRMIQDAPWWGIGPGLFSLVYPPYRSPDDSSSGFLVHNDYWQMLLETGIPGLLLLLAVLTSVVLMFVRALRAQTLTPATRIEVSGLVAGFAAISVHSFVDFNFHVLSIMLISGVALARVQGLVGAAIGWRSVPIRPPTFLRPAVYRLVLALLFLFPVLYFANIMLAATETDRAHALAKEGRLAEADAAYRRAFRHYPDADNVLVNHADLYRHILSLLSKDRAQERRTVFTQATEFLDQAEQINSLHPLNYLVRSRLYEQNRDLLGAEPEAAIEAAYRRALELNPRFYPARLAYAQFLLAAGRRADARTLVEAGLRHHYVDHEGIVPYLTLAARLRTEVGNQEGAAALRTRIEQALASAGWVRVRQPEWARLLQSTAAGP